MFDYFVSKHWIFTSWNSVNMWSNMSRGDKQIFYFDVKEIDWRKYFESYVLGTRQYIFKENNLPKAQNPRNNQMRFNLFKTAEQFIKLTTFQFC